MQENRSFDHYFGTLPNVRGFSDPKSITLSSGKPAWYQPDTSSPDWLYLTSAWIDPLGVLDRRSTISGGGQATVLNPAITAIAFGPAS